ncbi:MAG: outer membrane protein assembly factor BamD [Deltaproteobacteria bacterium]|nr:outer membrane protein assembly factor BamD [Deltaproteobacteria bacterium]
MQKKRVFLALLVVLFLISGCKIWLPWAKKTTDLPRSTPEGLYQQALLDYQSGDYKRAIELFQRVKEEYPLSQLALAAELGVGDAYFSGKQYIEAELVYSEFLNLHPTNENLPYVMYQIGMCHFNDGSTIDRDQTETFKALKEFERLMTRFPQSKFSFMAEKMIRECKKTLGEQEFYVGEFYFNIKEYAAALRRFEKIAREYPNVGLDYKVSFFIAETKRRLAESATKKKPVDSFVPPARRGLY